MRIAFTIGAYKLTPFIRLSILQLQKLAPGCAILVSDDPSGESPEIRKVCDELGVTYRGATARRGHFAADFQSLVNALVFAEAAGAEIAVKVSQRFIFRKPESIEVIRKTFADPNIMVATPGQPIRHNGSRSAHGFSAFTTLSDVVMMRVGAMTAADLLNLYRSRIRREQVPWASFIECVVDELHSRVFPGKTAKIAELTNPVPDPIYLRRYQATERQYRDLALAYGFSGDFTLVEWNAIEPGGSYFCRPIVI